VTVLWDDVAAVFFISREKPTAHRTLAELLSIADVHELRPDPRVEGLFNGSWAGLPCMGAVVEKEHYRLLWVSFSYGSFIDRVHPRPDDDSFESEPGLPLVHVFRDACDALEADVGMFLTSNWQASDEWVDELEWAVLGLFSIVLRSKGIGLLYLDAERVEAQSPQALLDEHDQLPARRGRLYFSGRGSKRWP